VQEKWIVKIVKVNKQEKAPHCPERTRAATQPTMMNERRLVINKASKTKADMVGCGNIITFQIG